MVEVATAAVKGGANLIQLRCKTMEARTIIETAKALKAAVPVPLIIDDRPDIAFAAGADGVHLGQDDIPCAVARAILGPHAIIGITAFEAAHFAALDPTLVDYVGTGPVYKTLTKPDKPVLGVERFAALVHLSPVPVVGIGGIDAGNAAPVMAAGAAGVAVIRAVGEAKDPYSAALTLRKAIQ